MFGRPGQRAGGAAKTAGDQLAQWLTTHADTWAVQTVIWQGQSWSDSRPSWTSYCSPVYGCPPTDPTGGHYDHLHVDVH